MPASASIALITRRLQFFQQILWAGFLLLVLQVFYGDFFFRPDQYLTDFQFYYYAAQLFFDGGNPYLSDQMNAIWGGHGGYRFVYPPLTLFLFGPLQTMSVPAASAVWLALKVVVLFGWIRILESFVLKNGWNLLSLGFLILGFHQALVIDLKEGNISLFEQFFLWWGIGAFLLKRYWQFVFGVVTASTFKFALFPLIGLIFLISSPQKWKFFFSATALLLGWVLLNGLSFPEAASDYFSSIGGLEEIRLIDSPSSLVVIRSVFFSLGLLPHQTLGDEVVYGILVLFLLGHTGFLFFQDRTKEKKISLWVCQLLFVYALLIPRLKDYSLMLLLPAALLFIQSSTRKSLAIGLACFSFTQGWGIWLTLLGLWGASAQEIRKVHR